jgi:hypothetical protein
MTTPDPRSEKRDTSTRFRAEPKTHRQARSRSTSRGDPPDDGDLERLYEDLFGTPVLGPSALEATAALEAFARVFEVAKDRPAVARAALSAAERTFFRTGDPFQYDVRETAVEAGGQSA